MAEERWSPVPDYAGWYEASDWGQVYSLPRAAAAGGLLHPKLNSRGYYQVGLCKYGRVTQVLVGRIVLDAAERVIGREIQASDHQALIDEAIAAVRSAAESGASAGAAGGSR